MRLTAHKLNSCVPRMPIQACIIFQPVLTKKRLSCSVMFCRQDLTAAFLMARLPPGSSVAIVGSGPIGLAALLTAQLYSSALIVMIDLDHSRLEVAMRFGATHAINSANGNSAEAVMQLSSGGVLIRP